MTDRDSGQRVAEALRSRDLNQSQLAAKVATTGSTISRVIVGKLGLSVELAEQVAAITGVRAGWLLTGELPMRRGQDLNAVAEASYLAGGHALLVGVPGLAKTLLVSTAAEAADRSSEDVVQELVATSGWARLA